VRDWSRSVRVLMACIAPEMLGVEDRALKTLAVRRHMGARFDGLADGKAHMNAGRSEASLYSQIE
jgi:hypothetical protein